MALSVSLMAIVLSLHLISFDLAMGSEQCRNAIKAMLDEYDERTHYWSAKMVLNGRHQVPLPQAKACGCPLYYLIAIDEKLESMKPDLDAFNVALERCSQDLEFVSEGEKVVEMMSILGIHLDESGFGFLAYSYALKGLEEKIVELEGLMDGFSFSSKKTSNC
ncbi:hypothetical protein AAG906_019002 [Vitis piasezkii]